MAFKKRLVLSLYVSFILAFSVMALSLPADIQSPAGGSIVGGTVDITGVVPQPDSFFDVFVCPSDLGYAPGVTPTRDGCTVLESQVPGPVEAPATLATWDTGTFGVAGDSFFDIFVEVFSNGELIDHDAEQNIEINNDGRGNEPLSIEAGAEREIIDLENYEGSNVYFYDPKCTWFVINTSTNDIGDVQINLGEVLQQMFQNIDEISDFDAEAYNEYLAEDTRNPSLQNGLVAQADGQYQYWFCPAVHITDLLNSDVLSSDDDYDGFSRFLSEKIMLGDYQFPVSVIDEEGNVVNTSVNMTVVDVTVPLEEGWTLRSTPLMLDGDAFWITDRVDAVLRFNAASQLWELVTDNTMVPLEALYFHSTDRNQYGIIFERSLTSPPVRTLRKGWNLYGATVPVEDSWYWPDEYYCSSDEYYASNCYLSWINEQDIANGDRCIGDALATAIYTDNGNRGVGTVVAERQYLSYSDDYGEWYFQQANSGTWVWVPEIDEQGATPDNRCDRDVKNFGGYWIFMENDDDVAGFTTTPAPIRYS